MADRTVAPKINPIMGSTNAIPLSAAILISLSIVHNKIPMHIGNKIVI